MPFSSWLGTLPVPAKGFPGRQESAHFPSLEGGCTLRRHGPCGFARDHGQILVRLLWVRARLLWVRPRLPSTLGALAAPRGLAGLVAVAAGGLSLHGCKECER